MPAMTRSRRLQYIRQIPYTSTAESQYSEDEIQYPHDQPGTSGESCPADVDVIRDSGTTATAPPPVVLRQIPRRLLLSSVLFSLLFFVHGMKELNLPPSPRPHRLSQGCGELIHSRLRAVQVGCRTQPELIISAFEGIEDAMGQCRERMRFQNWDCTDSGNMMLDPPLLKYGYRESAFVWAMSSAGAAWGVATACAQGWLDECACTEHDNNPQQGWQYGGCSSGVQHGITASRKLLSKTTATRSPIRKIEKHNLKAGRMAVKKTLIASCKCHGVSGSCQQKTCWKKTATLTHITDYLVDKYARARLLEDNVAAKQADLLYLEHSPNHCDRPRSEPRVCAWRNETHIQGDCDRLCCGRGFTTTHQVIHYKCDCKFVWCCNLVCKDCLQHRWVSTCN